MSIALDSTELREMLGSHKDCSVVFLVDSDVVGEDGWNWYVGGYFCKEGEVLDCEQEVNPEHTYTDREGFREDVERYVCLTAEKYLTDEEIDARVDAICKQYETCWKKAIIVDVTT